MNPENLAKILKENNQPEYRLKQIQKAIFTDGVLSFSEITTIPKDLRELLDREIKTLSFEAKNILVSSDKCSIKALLKLADGNLIETVLISPKPGVWSACISSQVGCPLGCRFCATGKMGFKRNLTAEEITDQVLFWTGWLKKSSCNLIRPAKGGTPFLRKGEGNKVNTVVFMGMGEPFLNRDQVSRSIRDLINPELFGFGSRSISVSTAGIPEGIEKMATEFPQINLAISLHFASDEKKSLYMPINKKYNLAQLRNALTDYFKSSNRKVFLEYILLSGINDSREDADNLIKYIKSINKPHLLHVNLIRYNETSGRFRGSEAGVARQFRDYLLENGVNTTIRKSLGSDIRGACGQLAGK